MKVAVLQFDNRPAEALGAMPALVQMNRTYAARHGYDHHFITDVRYDLPIYWQKPLLCRDLLGAGYDLVAWLDTDAVVHDQARRLEGLFNGPEAMLAAGDNPLWGKPFNAGVFLVKAHGLEVMTRWSELFAGTAWTRTETAWICQEEWAGPDFEQGAFAQHMLEPLTRSGALRLLDWRTLQSPFPVAGAFTLHFPGPFRVNIPVYLHAVLGGVRAPSAAGA